MTYRPAVPSAPAPARAAMHPLRAADALFNDPQVFPKLIIAALITGLASVFTPLLIGLAGWAVLFGCQVAIVRGMRRGVRHPLPRWDDFESLFQQGGRPLLAWMGYTLPLIGLWLIEVSFGQIGGWFGAAVTLALACLTLPLIAVYLLGVLPVYTLALGQYAEQPRLAVFWQVRALLRTAYAPANRRHTLTYAAYATVVGMGLIVLYAIPCIGWAAGLALTIPLTGVLGGLYAAAVWGQPPAITPGG